MRMTYKGPNNIQIVAVEPDEHMSEYFKSKIREALVQEWNEYIQEVCVALRKMNPGEKITISSKPVVTKLEKPIENLAGVKDK